MAYPCYDCVNVHGDIPSEWLNKWPKGAEYREDYNEYLCDGCYEERYGQEQNMWYETHGISYGDE